MQNNVVIKIALVLFDNISLDIYITLILADKVYRMV